MPDYEYNGYEQEAQNGREYFPPQDEEYRKQLLKQLEEQEQSGKETAVTSEESPDPEEIYVPSEAYMISREFEQRAIQRKNEQATRSGTSPSSSYQDERREQPERKDNRQQEAYESARFTGEEEKKKKREKEKQQEYGEEEKY